MYLKARKYDCKAEDEETHYIPVKDITMIHLNTTSPELEYMVRDRVKCLNLEDFDYICFKKSK